MTRTIKLTRQRIVSSSFNAKSTDHGMRLSRLKDHAVDDLAPWDRGWFIKRCEIVSTQPDPKNHTYPEHNQMVIVKALVTEEKNEIL